MSESIKYKIIKILSEQTLLDPSEIKENLSLEELGVDSLALVEIVCSIEETFNITIPFNANDPTNSTFAISNVSSIISAVENLVNSAFDIHTCLFGDFNLFLTLRKKDKFVQFLYYVEPSHYFLVATLNIFLIGMVLINCSMD